MSQTVDALTVDAPLALAFTGPAGGPFAGVNGRVYGTGNGCAPTSACSALTFGITGGVSSGYAAPTITSQPGAWNCTLAAATYSCSSGALSNASTSTFTLAANDNGNSVVPAGTSTAVSEALTIDGAMNLAAVSTSPLPQGVTGRSYGTGGTCSPLPACAPVQYHVTGGLGTYQAPTAALGASDTFTCTVGATYSCFTNVINGGAGSPTLTSTVQDVANQSSPSGQATNSSLLITIQAPITVTPEQTSWPTAVVGRSYGMLGTPQNFDATGGISPYVSFVPVGGSFPGTFTCTPSTPSGSPGQCSSATITGIAGTPYAPEVTAKDTGSQSAPPGTGTSSNIASVAVSPALQITTTTLPNALVAYPYPNPATPTASTLAATGGVVGTYTWLGPGAVSCTVAPAGTLPSNITLSAAGELAGTPATASATDTQFTFDVCVSDAGNSMVPAGNVTSGNYTVNVLNTFAYVAEPNVPQVEVVNTTTKAAVSQIALTSGTGPSNVAISPNGARAYVTLGDTNALAVIDTITNTLSSTHSIAGCIAPQGVAATATLIYVACTGSNTVAVLNATTFAATTTITPPAGGNPIGVAIRSDNARVYVTLSGLNRILIIDNTQSPPVAIAMTALDSGNGNVPMGIALAPSGGKTYAYIAKQEGTASNPGIDVFDVTTDTPGSVVSIALSASPTLEVPEFVAATPDFGRVYVSLQGTGAVAVVTNATTPALLNRVALASGASPEGIAIPPLISPPGTGLFVYVSDFNNNNLALIDNASTPALDAGSPVALTAASAPDGIAAIPVPQ
jgi:YVTN family beta-propeller protein